MSISAVQGLYHRKATMWIQKVHCSLLSLSINPRITILRAVDNPSLSCYQGTQQSYVRFQVLMTVSMKFRVFWDVVTLKLRVISEVWFTLMMEAVCTPETLVNFNVTTKCYIPEDSKLHTRHCENLKSHMVNLYGEATLHCVR
jgi:hypothetical protein